VYLSSVGYISLAASCVIYQFDVVVVINCMYSFYYEDTSCTPVICLFISSLCDNNNHDLPQYVT